MTNATQERRIRREPNTKSWWDSVRRLVRCRCVSLVMEQCCSVGVVDHEFPAAVRLTAHDLGRCLSVPRTRRCRSHRWRPLP